MTPQQPMIKDQIDPIIRIVKRNPLLPRLKTKSPPHFQQKRLQMCNEMKFSSKVC